MSQKVCFYQRPFPRIRSYYDMIDLAAEYGHDAIEGFSNMELACPDKEAAKKLREYADSKNIKFCCLSVYANIAEQSPSEFVKRLKDYADVAFILGSPLLHHTVIAEFEDPQKVLCRKEELFEKAVAAIREIYDYAESLGVRTVYEDQGFILNGVAGVGRLLDAVERNIGLVADFGNIAQSGECITDFIKAFPDRIAHVHIKDVKVSDKPLSKDSLITIQGRYMTEVKLGTGDVKLAKALQLLRDIGYNGYLAAEFTAKEDGSKDMDEGFDLIMGM